MWKEKYQIAINSSNGTGNNEAAILRSTIQQKEMIIQQQESMLKNVTNELGVVKVSKIYL